MRRILSLVLLPAAVACSRRPSFDDPARPITVHPGTEFGLALKANHSTGYEWVLVDSAGLGPLRLVGREYSIPWAARGRNGAGGSERWVFRAVSAGDGVVALVYRRPWETRPPADSARFRVTVR